MPESGPESGQSRRVRSIVSCISSLAEKERDYLIKCNGDHGDQVKIEELSPKYVFLYFWWLCEGLSPIVNSHLEEELKELYRDYGHEFEVVFVALGHNEDIFRDSFSGMPWLAIPLEDQDARHFFITEFAIPSFAVAQPVLFAPDGTLIVKRATFRVCTYGAHAFPFTQERIDDMRNGARACWDKLVWEKDEHSLTELFGGYVISPEGNKVLTSEFKGKTVGLHFFEISDLGFERTAKLLEMWKLLKDRRCEDFEIVFINKNVNFSIAKSLFEKEFGYPIQWYSLPFDGRELCVVFRHCPSLLDEDLEDAGSLIILKRDRYQSLNYFGFEVLEEFGIDAFPFTLESAVMSRVRESKQQEKLILGELLSPSAPLCRGGSAGYKEMTTISKLSGKRVLLLFATHSCYECGSFLPELKRMYLAKELDFFLANHYCYESGSFLSLLLQVYLEIKGNLEKKGAIDDDFEIIYISLDCDESPTTFCQSIQGMPWLVHSFVPDFGFSLAKKVFGIFPPQLPAVAAFGPNGQLKTKESNLAFKTEWTYSYPFIKADLLEEVCRELAHEFNWPDLESIMERLA